MADTLVTERVWYSSGAVPSVARALLAPCSWAFGAAVRARNTLYDAGVLRSAVASIPVLSVGNLTTGGTGKTPLAAYFALRLRAAGATPAIVMRGVGDDESRAYDVLAPGVPIVVDPDRVRGVREAAQRGADVAVLDDAFQHRRIQRAADVVVLSADRDSPPPRLLPAGPFREPLANLRRATLIVIARKAATAEVVLRTRARAQRANPDAPIVHVALQPSGLVAWSGGTRTLEGLRGQRVLVVAAIGDPAAFVKQLAQYASQIEALLYRDHHVYSDREIAHAAGCAASFDTVVCTLKDAVKLGPRWPRQAPELWYVSQRLEVEYGDLEVGRMLARLLDLRHSHR